MLYLVLYLFLYVAICQKLGMVLYKEDIDYDNQDDDKESEVSEGMVHIIVVLKRIGKINIRIIVS